MKSFLKDLASKDKKLRSILFNIDLAIDDLRCFQINDSALDETTDELIDGVEKLLAYFGIKTMRIDVGGFYKTERVFIEEDEKGLHIISLDLEQEKILPNCNIDEIAY